jgi:hypothetical protein
MVTRCEGVKKVGMRGSSLPSHPLVTHVARCDVDEDQNRTPQLHRVLLDKAISSMDVQKGLHPQQAFTPATTSAGNNASIAGPLMCWMRCYYYHHHPIFPCSAMPWHMRSTVSE